jgi:O-acetyl-ADP-ribose deacetylase (regulator of RNase III)
MIYEVTGDILLTDAQAIAHGIAPNDHLNTGLALSLRQDWPAYQKDFRHYMHTNHATCGTLWAWGGTGGRRIVSLFTQEPAKHEHSVPGKATTANVNHCLRELHQWIITEKIQSIALPRLATGVGGLEWGAVRPLIETHLGSLKIPVFLYTHYQAGVKAEESALALISKSVTVH